MTHRNDLLQAFDQLLAPERFKDYGSNGLQVEGCGVAFLACGHHATERYGAPAVAGHVAWQLGLEHEFIDIPNPA
jgi:putative NIF3 family GTP cyclohydrolase 1 type 2